MGNPLEVKDLSVDYRTNESTIHAVHDVSFNLKKGEVLCLVGESGCGKSTVALAIMSLLAKSATVTQGRVELDSTDLLHLNKEELRQLRGRRISMIFQDPMTTLNPVESIRTHLVETIVDHAFKSSDSESSTIDNALNSVGFPSERIKEYPHQLSGGMRQRIMIALSLLLNPEIVIADEPTTSLDVLVEAQILDIFESLKRNRGISMLFITHNFGVVAQIADRVAVMYAGEIVEMGDVQEIFDKPLHPYTDALMKSVPHIEDLHRHIRPLAGSPPSLTTLENACPFRDRCPRAFERCANEHPTLKAVEGRSVSCHLYE